MQRKVGICSCDVVVRANFANCPATDMAGTLYKLIDDVETLLSHMSSNRTLQLVVKYDGGDSSRHFCGKPKRMCRTKAGRRRLRACQDLATEHDTMHVQNGNEDDDSACLKMIGNENALAYSSNLNNGFIGIQTADTVCPSASMGANELRTSEDALEEHQ